jgi:hypothetical protein
MTGVFDQCGGALIDHLEGHDVTAEVISATANLLAVDRRPGMECFGVANRATVCPSYLFSHKPPCFDKL